MGLFDKLKKKLLPLRLEDPQFGQITFMSFRGKPEESYWEIRWRQSEDEDWLEISLPGTEHGLDPKAREFFWRLQPRLPEFMTMLASRLTDAVRTNSTEPVPDDIYTMVRFTGLGIEDPDGVWPKWELSFESMGEKWLGITIPFSGDSPQTPIVDTWVGGWTMGKGRADGDVCRAQGVGPESDEELARVRPTIHLPLCIKP